MDDAHPPFARREVAAVLVVLAAALTALSGRYGFHRDELYFVVAGDHPAWGYVDQPPLTPLLARAATALFGATPAGLRVAATLCGVAAVALAALIARELGAGRGGQVLTACAAAGSAFVLVVVHMLATTSVDLVVWLAVCLSVARMLRTADPRWWAVAGAVVGVGLLNKDLVLLLVAGLGTGLLVCGPRAVLPHARSSNDDRTDVTGRGAGVWLPVGAAVALLLVAPNLVWQARNGWPMLTVATGIAADARANRILFVPEQLVYLSPVLVPVWVAGLVRFWRDPALRWARPFGLAYPVVAVLGREFAATVGTAVGQIPPDQRGRAVIVTGNYGEAAALVRYGPARGLPGAWSGHMSFADWGPPPDGSAPVLLVHRSRDTALEAQFVGCRAVGEVTSPDGVPNQEQGARLVLCDGVVDGWAAAWPRLRRSS